MRSNYLGSGIVVQVDYLENRNETLVTNDITKKVCRAVNQDVSTNSHVHIYEDLDSGAFEFKEIKTNLIDDIINQPKTLTLFTAPWCASCKFVRITIDDLLEKFNIYHNSVNIVQPEVAAFGNRFNVNSLPTLLFLKENEVWYSMVGKKSWGEYKYKIKEFALL